MLDIKNTNHHQVAPNSLYIGVDSQNYGNKQRQTPKTPPTTPLLEVSVSKTEASNKKENFHIISEATLQSLLQQACEIGVQKAFVEIENHKRHLINEKYRLKHVDAAEYLKVSINTLSRNRDTWCLVHYKEGNSRFYTKKSLDLFIKNRS